ncbi:MAG: glycosyltransferase family 4 protein [Spirosomataceae bacterium]
MKIVIIQGAFLPVPPVQGGAVEKIWYRMGKEFAALGHQVVHISKKHENLASDEKVHDVHYVRVTGFKTPKSLIILKLLDFFYSFLAIQKIPKSADVIITNTFWAPLLLRGKLGKKVYVDVQRVPKGQMKFYTHVFRLRSNSLFVTNIIKKEIKHNYHHLISTIPNPLPISEFAKISFLDKKRIILYVGRLHPEKGVHLLIQAYKQTNQQFRLKIVGSSEIAFGGGGSEYMTSLEECAKNLNIEFLGPIYDEDLLNKLYQASAIFVYPSLAETGETFGLAPLEAMSWGCVPIVSDLSCFKDFIKPEENGLSFNHRSDNAVTELSIQIQRLQDQPTLLSSMSNMALQVRDTHSIESITKQFLNDFQKSFYK